MLEPLYQYLRSKADLSEEDFRLLEPCLERRHFGKNVYLTDIGDQENFVNFVAEGLVRKFFLRQGEEVTTQLAKEKDLICSSVSFLTGKPSEYVVEALEPVTAVSISRESVEKLYKQGPRMERMGRLIIADWLLQKEKWDLESVILTPRERFVAFMKDNSDLLRRVPQKYLASYLNITPETFSRFKHLIP